METLCLICVLLKSQSWFISVYGYYVELHRLRTAIATALRGDSINGWLCHFGLKCSSFTCVNVGTSGRSACTPWGILEYQSVQNGNMLASRILDQQKIYTLLFCFVPDNLKIYIWKLYGSKTAENPKHDICKPICNIGNPWNDGVINLISI